MLKSFSLFCLLNSFCRFSIPNSSYLLNLLDSSCLSLRVTHCFWAYFTPVNWVFSFFTFFLFFFFPRLLQTGNCNLEIGHPQNKPTCTFTYIRSELWYSTQKLLYRVYQGSDYMRLESSLTMCVKLLGPLML